MPLYIVRVTGRIWEEYLVEASDEYGARDGWPEGERLGSEVGHCDVVKVDLESE